MRAWKDRARKLKTESLALYFACLDPRVPIGAKVLAACVVGYGFSPIDLIPDFIPILGHVDDLIVLPLGIALVLKMIPPAVLAECRAKAQQSQSQSRPVSWISGLVIASIWLLLVFFIIRLTVYRVQNLVPTLNREARFLGEWQSV
jgi:uncharacterized membrane protein YkvA (DUF1232 family)